MKKGVLLLSMGVTLVSAITLAAIGNNSLNVSPLSITRADPPYGFTFNSITNKLYNVNDEQTHNGNITLKTDLNNDVDFTYQGVKYSDHSWQVLAAGGSFNNTKAITGMGAITITFNTNNVDFTIYYSGDDSFDHSEELTSSTAQSTTFDFDSYYPNYFKIVNNGLVDLDIASISISFTCNDAHANYQLRNIENSEMQQAINENNQELDLVNGLGLQGYENTPAPKEAHKNLARTQEEYENDENIVVVTKDKFNDYSCLKLILELEDQLNEKLENCNTFMLNVLLGQEQDANIVRFGVVYTNYEAYNFIVVEENKEINIVRPVVDEQGQRTGDFYTVLRSNRQVTTYLFNSRGFEIYEKRHISYIDQEVYPDDINGTIFDEYLKVSFDGSRKITEIRSSTLEINRYAYGLAIKHIFSIYKSRGAVFYTDYEKYLAPEFQDQVTHDFTTTMFKDGVATTCAFEYRPDEPYYGDPLLKDDRKVFWTIQIGLPNFGDVRLFPFANVYCISFDFFTGWQALYFQKAVFDMYERYLDFVGILPDAWMINDTIYEFNDIVEEDGYSYYNAQEYVLYPTASYAIQIDEGVYDPGRLAFVEYFDVDREEYEGRSFKDIIYDSCAVVNLIPNIPAAMDEILDLLTPVNLYDTNVLSVISSIDEIYRWRDTPVNTIQDISNYTSYCLKFILNGNA